MRTKGCFWWCRAQEHYLIMGWLGWYMGWLGWYSIHQLVKVINSWELFLFFLGVDVFLSHCLLEGQGFNDDDDVCFTCTFAQEQSYCDPVMISRLLNATLVIPEIQESTRSKGIRFFQLHILSWFLNYLIICYVVILFLRHTDQHSQVYLNLKAPSWQFSIGQ